MIMLFVVSTTVSVWRATVLNVTLNEWTPLSPLLKGATPDVFGIGSYGLAVTFDATNTISSSALESVLTGPDQNLGPSDINAIFLNPNGVLFNNQSGGGGGDGGGGSTIQLAPLPGYAPSTPHYGTTASLASSSSSCSPPRESARRRARPW